MTAVAVEITQRPVSGPPTKGSAHPTSTEFTGVLIVDDVESLTDGATPGCGDDNPYN
jgi:hypothetical protein